MPGGESGYEVKGLEDEPYVFAAEFGELVVLLTVQLGTADTDNSLGVTVGRIKGSERLHQRGLARAGRPHNGGELTVLEVNAHIVQGMNGCFALAVGFEQVPCGYRRSACGDG